MGEKFYKPVIKEGDHLIRSSKNPDRVRGLSRDADNKNQDIIEWEEFEIETDDRVELEQELDSIEKQEGDIVAILNAVNTGLENLNKLMEFLDEHPEIVAAIVTGGKHVKDFVSSNSKKLYGRIKSILSFNKKTKAEILLEQQASNALKTIACDELNVVESVKIENEEKEDMSIDEARELLLDILANYIDMKKKLDRLSKANINTDEFPTLSMDQVVAYMDDFVEKYPALMDDKMSISVLDLLRGNFNSEENERILETLKIASN